jgi:signal peptidase I
MTQKNKPAESWWTELLKTLGLSVFFSFGITTYAAQSFWIPTGSMEPTLQINDRLMVDKVSYRFQEPHRGDIVVFQPTQALTQRGFKDAFVKRVIGVPGDRISVFQGEVIINGHRLAEDYVSHPSSTFIAICAEGNTAFLSQPQIIPPDHYLVLGDNRNDSYDGRCWGLVAKQNLVGKAMFRFWPFNRTGVIPTTEPLLRQ